MKKIIMLSGVGGTGKSTYAKSLNLKGNIKIISSDEIRYNFTHAYNVLLNNMFEVYDKMIEICNDFIINSQDIIVILDSTFLNDERRNYFLDRLKGYDEIELHMLKVHDTSIIYKRNKMRIKEKWIPEEVLTKMINSFTYPDKKYLSRYTLIKEVYLDETK